MTKIARPAPKISRRGFNGRTSYDWDNGGIIFDPDFVEKALNRSQVKKDLRESSLKRYYKGKKETRDTRRDFNKMFGPV